MRSQASFQLARIDEEAKPLKRVGLNTEVAMAAHICVIQTSGGASFAETRMEVNAVVLQLFSARQ